MTPSPKRVKKTAIKQEESNLSTLYNIEPSPPLGSPLAAIPTTAEEPTLASIERASPIKPETVEPREVAPSPSSSTTESERGSSFSGNDGATSTDATSVDEDTIVVEPPLTNPTISKLRKTRRGKLPSSLTQAKVGSSILISQSTTSSHPAVRDDTASILSELPSDFELDDSSMSIQPKAQKSLKRKRRMDSPTIDIDHAPPVRIPGDYVLTSALLSEPAMAWINCKICEESFVQKDAYFTRASCPRCERHSKLYGYMWPKTDKDGKGDTEERVLDHRVIHRFVKPSEEKIIRRLGRGSLGSRGGTRDGTREETEVEVEVDVEVEEEVVKSRRGRPRKTRLTM
jgi:histone-lysine N-methyltransferase SUV420H